jgi:phosphate transport system permease protein
METFSSTLQSNKRKEFMVKSVLIAATAFTIFTTFGILFSILFEAIEFFKLESFWYFISGTEWSPGVEGAKYGAVPIFTGTFMITAIALLVAVPIGVYSAIYLAEYASNRTRSIAKPLLETLAGIPTVVYGFFAAITVAPFFVEVFGYFGMEASFNNALACGVVMGIMIIPIIASLSDDVITSVPDSMRKGSLALGMTKSETIKFIVVPAAMPGIISAVLLGVSRAIGETMIVVMAAGVRANLSWNPLEDMTTVTVRIVDALTGDHAFGTPETLSAFALGLVLFVVTLILNIASVYTIKVFKEKYKSSNL